MKHIPKLLAILTVLSFFACSENAEPANAAIEAKSAMSQFPSENTGMPVEKKLVKEGEIEFETDDILASRKQIAEALNRAGGYITSDQELKEPGRKVSTVVVRVPAGKLDAFIAEATSGVERFDRKDIRVRDVTEEFVDIEARLKVKKKLESRFMELLSQTKSVTEILEIEKQMAQVRSEIESVEGRLKYLQSQVSFSTLSFTFYQRIAGETAFGEKFKDGFSNGWKNLIWFLVFLVNLWPFLLIIGLIIFLLKYYGWKKKRKALTGNAAAVGGSRSA